MPQRFLRKPGQPFGGLALAFLVVSFASPAGAAAESLGQPPWWVRARRAAEKRFSLSSELFYERQESLRIAAFDQFLQVVDLETGEEHGFQLPGDPALLNRKFDLRFEKQGAGTGLTVALPTLGFLYPTLTFDAGQAEVTLDFHDVTESRDSTSLRGRGALFDTRLDLVAAPCRRCPWFTATVYRFEKLPSIAVDRSPRFDIQGFSISRDDVQLGREVHEISSRVGYAPPGGRVISFVGVQHRWTDLDIDDRIAYRVQTSESRLSSHTRLESEATLAVAGLDVELGPRWSGRFETAVGDEDSSAWIGFAFQPSSSGRPTERIRNARLAREIARLRTEFAQEVASLPQVGWAAAAKELLDRFEKRLLALLPLPEFDALQSLVIYRFDEARQQLASAATQPDAASSPHGAHREYVLAALAVRAQSGGSVQSNRGFFRKLYEEMGRLVELIESNDLTIRLCVQTGPEDGGRPTPSPTLGFNVEFLPWMYLRPNPDYWLKRDTAPMAEESLDLLAEVQVFDNNGSGFISRGLYGYFAQRTLPDQTERVACPGNPCTLVDLTLFDFPYVVCTAKGCVVREQDAKWRGCDGKLP